ncbi:MAG: SUMF1/EgtB/PvdO family nonheme iron enzyme [Rhodobacteraceae bacterium]|nr:SUMF1/EgtB/PvdO family nonheme iron enzyme [Paracoccaceae bacterium]
MRLFSRRKARPQKPRSQRLASQRSRHASQRLARPSGGVLSPSRWLAATWAAAALLLTPAPASADGAVALLIGNAVYENTPPLTAPSNDVAALEKLLVVLGYDVTVVRDATSTEMRSALRDFGQQARDAEKALFYYSGHGLEIAEENYLIPVDAVLMRETDARREAVELNAAVINASRASDISVVIIDAARRNDFPIFRRRDPLGFKPVPPQARQVVAFATAPESMAVDSDTEFSPYTWALTEALADDATQDVRELFISLDAATSKYAGATQMPTARFGDMSASSAKLAYIAPPPESEAPPPATTGVYDPSMPALARFQDCPACPIMIVLPSGRFTVGSPATEQGRQVNEGPQHEVRLKSFAIGAAEITRKQFATFVAATGYDSGAACRTEMGGGFETRSNRSWRQPEFDQIDWEPVVCVSWEDAQAYVKWLNQQVPDGGYRLPSEAEWEYAARAGAATLFNTGGQLTDRQANFNAEAPFNGAPVGRFRRRTLPIGVFPPNKWGLYDIHGNVWEWTQDCWNDSHSPETEKGAARKRGDCTRAAIRGGSWYDTAALLRLANRAKLDRLHRSNVIGFRVARDLE